MHENQQEVFDNDHRVVSQRGSSAGRFTFSAADAGEHRICFTPSSSSGRQGWLSALHPNGGIKLSLDLAIGESSEIESTDKGKMEDISQRVRDLNARLQDIRREQVFQRVGAIFTTIVPIYMSSLILPIPNTCGSIAGTRGRIQRPVRKYQLSCRAMDADPGCRSGRYLCMATLSSQILLHQAEAYVKHSPLCYTCPLILELRGSNESYHPTT